MNLHIIAYFLAGAVVASAQQQFGPITGMAHLADYDFVGNDIK